jgi:leader peptidase (prepilin peptidase) / N-methyltransferase
MNTLLFLLLFIYGITFGSFFNVVGLRIPLNQSIVKPRSACPSCGRYLSAFDLIPVFSYMFLRGKCRVCKARISPVYPVMELLTGLLFVLAAYRIGWIGELFIALTLVSLLMIITVSDISYMIIPDKILLFFAGLFLLERISWPLDPWWDSLLGATIGFLLLLLIAVISKGGMGGGDIKLFALIGFVLGTKLFLLAFFLSTLYGALFGVFGLLTKLIKRRQPIPFGPYIVAGALTAYFWGEQLIELYLRLLQ